MRKLLFLFCLLIIVSCKEKSEKTQGEPEPDSVDMVAKVAVAKEGDRYYLTVNGEPFYIKGAGLEFGDVPSLAMVINVVPINNSGFLPNLSI